MTAPRAAIVFNATTGSDTAASGLGPATAISGTAAAHTGGAASTTITLTGSPDLSGVQTGDLLWLNTASGRQFSVIASVNDGADTVTVDDSFTIAEASAVDFAIGGKRATWDNADSRTIFGSTGAKASWTIETETDQTLSSTAITVAVSGSTTNVMTIRGLSGARRAVTQGANAFCFAVTGTYIRFENLKAECSNGTKTSSGFATVQTTVAFFVDCACNSTNAIKNFIAWGSSGTPEVFLYDCFIANTTGTGISGTPSTIVTLLGTVLSACGDRGISLAAGGEIAMRDSIICGCTGDGINTANATKVVISNCTINGNTGDGIELNSSVRGCIVSCNITDNGGYGIKGSSAIDPEALICDYNNFGTGDTANTSGALSNVTAGANDVAVDPAYANVAGLDFSVGTSVKALGFPIATRYVGANLSTTRSYVDIGAAQRQEAAASGSSPRFGDMTGGLR